MSSFAVETNPRAVSLTATSDELIVRLADGRVVSVPLVWFPKLFQASEQERSNFRIVGDGEYITWPELDEDLSVAGFLRGTRAVMSSGV
jgi:hypothetical protein